MGKQIVVFEDSSKAGLGGGQRMTLLACDILSEEHQLHFIDFTGTSRYMQLVRDKFPASKITILHSRIFFNKMKILAQLFDLLCFIVFFKSNIRKLRQNIDLENSVVYATTKKGLIYASYLNRKFNTPYVYHAHLVENFDSSVKRYFISFLKKAKCIFCVSKVVFDSMPVDNKVLLYNPNQNNKGYKGAKTNKEFVVAVVGSLIKIKGFEYFIDAALGLSDKIEFRIYGEGCLEESLKKIAHGRVKFMGFNSDIIAEMYSSIDVIVVPTIIKESLSLVIVEAKSVGLPVITTNIGGQAEIVKDSVDGFTVPVKDSDSILLRINQLTSDLDLYNQMALASYRSVLIFDRAHFERIIRQVFSI